MDRYEIKTDIDLTGLEDGRDGYLLDRDDVLYVGEATTRDLLDEPDDTSWSTPEVVEATQDEAAEWRRQFTLFAEGMEKAEAKVTVATAVFRKIVEEARAEAQAAWDTYQPVHVELERRLEQVQEQREEAARAHEKALQEAAAAAQAAEDAELGPRSFYVTRPSQRGQDGRDMDVPTVHHVSCGIARRLKRLPHPVRIAEAFEALMDGGNVAKRWISNVYRAEERTEKRLPGAVCERCPAFDELKAHAPDTFMDWLQRTESQQFAPMPPDTYTGKKSLFKKLGLPMAEHYSEKEGWSLVSDKIYREPNAMVDGERLVGWLGLREKHDGGTELRVVKAPERLAKIFDLLPPRGFAVRWIHEPENFGGGVCDCAVAVRPMSKWEIRQRKESA